MIMLALLPYTSPSVLMDSISSYLQVSVKKSWLYACPALCVNMDLCLQIEIDSSCTLGRQEN